MLLLQVLEYSNELENNNHLVIKTVSVIKKFLA